MSQPVALTVPLTLPPIRAAVRPLYPVGVHVAAPATLGTAITARAEESTIPLREMPRIRRTTTLLPTRATASLRVDPPGSDVTLDSTYERNLRRQGGVRNVKMPRLVDAASGLLRRVPERYGAALSDG